MSLTPTAPLQVDPADHRRRLVAIVIVDGVAASHPLPAEGEVVFGRGEHADVSIEHECVSRRHARLCLNDGRISIEDLGSANGTRIGERTLRPGEPVVVGVHEVIDLGSVMMTLQLASRGEAASRVWSHQYLEARLEEECEHRDGTAPFALVRLKVAEGDRGAGQAEIDQGLFGKLLTAAMAAALPPEALLAAYAPLQYEVLLLERNATQAQAAIERLIETLGRAGIVVRAALASFPDDGRDRDTLLSKLALESGARAAPHAGDIVAVDPAILRLYRLAERIAKSDLNVLLLGETGSGKELVAGHVQRHSQRAERPLLRLNCAAFSESLVESELFGYERGAFTGAGAAKPGLLEAASGGTVFLDEVAEMPLSVQAKLLRAVENREVLRVGGLEARPVDVRYIAATNRDLEAMVRQGAFREDLYYRLNGFTLTVPPLRDRRLEIMPLAERFVSDVCARQGQPNKVIAAAAAAALSAYDWPGNVRELRNTIERAVVLASGKIIGPEHLPMDKMRGAFAAAGHPAVKPCALPDTTGGTPSLLREELEQLERQRIVEALAQAAGNQTTAAKNLGMSRAQLVRKLKTYSLPRPRRSRGPS